MSPTVELLQTLANQHGQSIALDDGTTQVNYAELATSINALAVALQTQDPTPGSVVGLCAEHSIEYLVCVLAITEAGKVFLPLNCHGSTNDLIDVINAAQVSVLLVDELGDALIQTEDDAKIRFSQLPGLVYTYRDKMPERPVA